LKDLPTEATAGLCLGAVPKRGPISDVLVSRGGESFDELPKGAVLGTGSIRRQAQLLRARPDLIMKDIRGNVDTRLTKLEPGQYDAVVLAEAGLTRLGLKDRITQVLPRSLILPAIGQGALGLETRQDDETTREAVEALNDSESHASVLAERSLLAALRGGCLAPVGAWGRMEEGKLRLDAVVLSPDGKQALHACGSNAMDQAEVLGRSVAEQLLQQGAARLIEASRKA